ncbi:DUF4238 domain-containing protein [Runella zeae]|uniref:DUF4238 domain-containing protein n=1 Tax=Runella zeae TaxID=94255 RepID=UPI00048DC115|nr:DUF4238 domain-containing protein [Runella zeae]
MTTKKNHHFVPKRYLKEFGKGKDNDLYLWKLDLSKSILRSEKSYIGKTLCTKEYFYRINTQESFLASRFGQNPDIIEDEGFDYEKEMPRLLAKLKEKKENHVLLSVKDTCSIVNMIVSIKFRNPYVRDVYESLSGIKDHIPTARQHLENILKKINPQDKALMDYANELKKKYEYDLENPQELLRILHTVALYLDPESGLASEALKLKKHLINSKWEIIRTHPNSQIITSDNPGIFFNKENVWSLIFDDFDKKRIDRFFFPLSPLHGLLIHLLEIDTKIGPNKEKVVAVTYSPNKVAEYNICHCTHANKILIGADEKALVEAAKRGQSAWVEAMPTRLYKPPRPE